MATLIETQSRTTHTGISLPNIMSTLQAIGRWIRLRNTLGALEKLDDHMLRDIGLNRDDLTQLRMASSASTTFGTFARRRMR